MTFENTSALDVYEKAIDAFRDYYQYEVIQGADRKMIEKIPEAAFREAIANVLIHRAWDINSHVRFCKLLKEIYCYMITQVIYLSIRKPCEITVCFLHGFLYTRQLVETNAMKV